MSTARAALAPHRAPHPLAANRAVALRLARLLGVVLLFAPLAAMPAADQLRNALDWRSVVALADKDDAAIQQGGKGAWTVTSSSFPLPRSIMPDEPELTCYYATPEAKNGKPSPRAQDAVYFFHTPNPGTRNPLDDPLCQRLVSQSGMTVFAISFITSSNSAFFFDPRQSGRFYANAQSGSFDAVIEAWSQVRRKLAITSAAFGVFGYSAGGIAAQHFVEEHPSMCACLVTANGYRFVLRHQARCPMFIIHTLGDGGAADGDTLARFYASIGDAVTRLHLNPNWGLKASGNDFAYHALNAAATPLAALYLEGLSDLRRAAGNDAAPAVATWPYAIASEDPRQIVAIRGKEWQAPFLDAGLTPMPIPSARFFRELMHLPLPARQLEVAKGIAMRCSGPAAQVAPVGVVALWQSSHHDAADPDRGDPDLAALDMDLQYASEHRFAACTAHACTTLARAMQLTCSYATAAAGLQEAAILFSPEPGEVQTAMGIPALNALVVVLRENDEIAPYLPLLQQSVAKGLHLKVLVSSTNANLYSAFLNPVSHDLRERFFAPIIAAGADAEGSVHQQQLAAGIAFIEQAGDKPPR